MLSKTSDYARAVREAYRMRWKYYSGSLEFDPFLPISVEKKLAVCKYSTFIKLYGADPVAYPQLISDDAFTIPMSGGNMICYNDDQKVNPARRRFSLAHELGHFALHHQSGYEWEEREADCFARNLLAPRLLALERGIPFDDYQTAFGISAAAARMCERMADEDERIARLVLNK